jgi:hypothetical protein
MSVYGSSPRTTLDGEWTEEELAGDIYDECTKAVGDYPQKYKNRAVYDSDLFKPQYLAEKIRNENDDLIEIYNKLYDQHRNENKFGIHWFDLWVQKQIRHIMSDNLVGNAK